MTDTLWAPWRMDFIEGKTTKEAGCVFCNAAHAPEEESRERLLLDRSEDALILLNRYPYVNAHLLVMPTAHVSSPKELTAHQWERLSVVLRQSLLTLCRVLAPTGCNMGMNLGSAAGAGIADHIHWHIVPRWVGDNNFMPVVGLTRVMPQHLEETYDRLKPAFQGVASYSSK